MGRPRIFKSKEELQQKIEGYFVYCAGEELRDADGNPVLNKYGEPVMINVHVPTVTGLARYIGLKSRQALINYQVTEKFGDIIRDAKMRVEEYAEERLFDRDGVRGAIFTLCNNFEWSEKPEDGSEEEMLKKMDEMIGAIDNAAKRKAE